MNKGIMIYFKMRKIELGDYCNKKNLTSQSFLNLQLSKIHLRK